MAVAGLPISWEYETVKTKDLIPNWELSSRDKNGWKLAGFAFNPGELYGGSLLTCPVFIGGEYIYIFKRRTPREAEVT